MKVSNMKITDEEYNQIIKELLERCKDLVFIGMPEKSIIEKIAFKPNTSVVLSVKFNGGDIQQILGKIRRKRS